MKNAPLSAQSKPVMFIYEYT